MTPFGRTLIAALGLSMLVGVVAAAPVTIADIAPRQTIFVATATDAARLRAAFERSELMALWREESIQEWASDFVEEMTEDVSDDLEKLGFEMDDLSMPSGPAGFALFPSGGSLADLRMDVIAMADFGENAETMHDLMMAGFERRVDDDELEIDEDDYGDVTIMTLTQVGGDDNEDFGLAGMGPNPFDHDTAHYARVGSTLLISTRLETLERAIDRMDGKDLEAIADDETYLRASRQLGDAHAHAVLVARPLLELAIQAGEEDGAPVRQILGALGIMEMQAASFGMTFDTDDAVLEQRFAMLVPRKRGLFALVPPDAPFTAPSFANADLSSYFNMRFDFAGILPLVKRVIASLPPEMGQQAEMQLGFVEGQIAPILANIGPDVYVVSSIERPFAIDSERSLLALRAGDEDVLANMMGGMGLEARDFAGNRIWPLDNLPLPMPMPRGIELAIGLGSGHLFVGDLQSVENALRAAADLDAPKLADEQRFKDAVAVTRGAGMGFTWADLERSLAYEKWKLDNIAEITRAQYRDLFGDDPDMQDFIEEQAEMAAEAAPELPDLDAVFEHLGDTVVEIRATEEGFSGRWLVLRPR